MRACIHELVSRCSIRMCFSCAGILKHTATRAHLNFASQSGPFFNAPLCARLCEGSLCETSHPRGSDSGVFVSLRVCVPVRVSASVSDLCVSGFSLPRSLHRGRSSVCQTGENRIRHSPLSDLTPCFTHRYILDLPFFFLFWHLLFVDEWKCVCSVPIGREGQINCCALVSRDTQRGIA